MDERFRPIVQIVEKMPSESDPLSRHHTLGIKWEWRDRWLGFWGIVRDREEALINVATTFYRAVRRLQREDHWYWRALYWMGDCLRWFVTVRNPGFDLEEAEEMFRHF